MSVWPIQGSDVVEFRSKSSNPIISLRAENGKTLEIQGTFAGSLANSGLTNGKLVIGDINNEAQERSISGDATVSNTGILTLANTTTTTGTYSFPRVTVDAKGRITAISEVTGLSGQILTWDTLDRPVIRTLSGDVTSVGSGIMALTSVISAANNIALPTISYDAKGRLTSVSQTMLTDGKVWIGSASNLPSSQTIGGDATLAANGTLTLAEVNLAPSTTILSTITTDSAGRVTDNLSATLPNANIWIGNGSSVPFPYAVTGDASMSNTGALTLAAVGANRSTTLLPSAITVDSKGRTTTLTDSGISASTNKLLLSASYTDLEIKAQPGGVIRLFNNLLPEPLAGTYEVGSSGARFNVVYTNYLDASNQITGLSLVGTTSCSEPTIQAYGSVITPAIAAAGNTANHYMTMNSNQYGFISASVSHATIGPKGGSLTEMAIGGGASLSSPDTNGSSLIVRGTFPQTPITIISDNATTHYAITFNNPNGIVGSVVTAGSNTGYNTASDYRLKKNIRPMKDGLEKVAKLRPCYYTWKCDNSEGEGFIAHELQDVVPISVTGKKDDVEENGQIRPQGIDTSFMVATLTSAIQELVDINKALEGNMSSLEQRIKVLEAKNK